MATQLQIRRGTNTQNASFTGAEGELSVNTTNDSVHVHDGSTAGGFQLARADLNNVSDTDLNAALTGNTLASLTITSADINGGNIDGTTIGASSAAAGTFTSVAVDNITIDGTEIDLSSGSLTLDVAGVIKLDADDAGEVRYLDGGTHYATIKKDGNNALFQSIVADGDFIIQGIDGASFVSAVTFDMSDGGTATFNAGASFGGSVAVGHTTTGGATFAISDNGNATIQFFPEISTDTNLTQHYDLTAAAYMTSDNRAAEHLFKIGTTEVMRILSSGGITFNGDTASANALDDYEEGSFSPTITGETGAFTTTGQATVGRYVKIGDFVHLEMDGYITTPSGGSGTLRLTGLPFSMAAGRSAVGSMTAGRWDNSVSGDQWAPFLAASTDYIQFRAAEAYSGSGDGIETASTATISGNTTPFWSISISYRVS